MSLFALLLRTTTEEGEDFLAFAYPANARSRGMQTVMRAKGVFLASGGIASAILGQPVRFMRLRLSSDEKSLSPQGAHSWDEDEEEREEREATAAIQLVLGGRLYLVVGLLHSPVLSGRSASAIGGSSRGCPQASSQQRTVQYLLGESVTALNCVPWGEIPENPDEPLSRPTRESLHRIFAVLANETAAFLPGGESSRGVHGAPGFLASPDPLAPAPALPPASTAVLQRLPCLQKLAGALGRLHAGVLSEIRERGGRSKGVESPAWALFFLGRHAVVSGRASALRVLKCGVKFLDPPALGIPFRGQAGSSERTSWDGCGERTAGRLSLSLHGRAPCLVYRCDPWAITALLPRPFPLSLSSDSVEAEDATEMSPIYTAALDVLISAAEETLLELSALRSFAHLAAVVDAQNKLISAWKDGIWRHCRSTYRTRQQGQAGHLAASGGLQSLSPSPSVGASMGMSPGGGGSGAATTVVHSHQPPSPVPARCADVRFQVPDHSEDREGQGSSKRGVNKRAGSVQINSQGDRQSFVRDPASFHPELECTEAPPPPALEASLSMGGAVEGGSDWEEGRGEETRKSGSSTKSSKTPLGGLMKSFKKKAGKSLGFSLARSERDSRKEGGTLSRASGSGPVGSSQVVSSTRGEMTFWRDPEEEKEVKRLISKTLTPSEIWNPDLFLPRLPGASSFTAFSSARRRILALFPGTVRLWGGFPSAHVRGLETAEEDFAASLCSCLSPVSLIEGGVLSPAVLPLLLISGKRRRKERRLSGAAAVSVGGLLSAASSVRLSRRGTFVVAEKRVMRRRLQKLGLGLGVGGRHRRSQVMKFLDRSFALALSPSAHALRLGAGAVSACRMNSGFNSVFREAVALVKAFGDLERRERWLQFSILAGREGGGGVGGFVESIGVTAAGSLAEEAARRRILRWEEGEEQKQAKRRGSGGEEGGGKGKGGDQGDSSGAYFVRADSCRPPRLRVERSGGERGLSVKSLSVKSLAASGSSPSPSVAPSPLSFLRGGTSLASGGQGAESAQQGPARRLGSGEAWRLLGEWSSSDIRPVRRIAIQLPVRVPLSEVLVSSPTEESPDKLAEKGLSGPPLVAKAKTPGEGGGSSPERPKAEGKEKSWAEGKTVGEKPKRRPGERPKQRLCDLTGCREVLGESPLALSFDSSQGPGMPLLGHRGFSSSSSSSSGLCGLVVERVKGPAEGLRRGSTNNSPNSPRGLPEDSVVPQPPSTTGQTHTAFHKGTKVKGKRGKKAEQDKRTGSGVEGENFSPDSEAVLPAIESLMDEWELAGTVNVAAGGGAMGGGGMKAAQPAHPASFAARFPSSLAEFRSKMHPQGQGQLLSDREGRALRTVPEPSCRASNDSDDSLPGWVSAFLRDCGAAYAGRDRESLICRQEGSSPGLSHTRQQKTGWSSEPADQLSFSVYV